jgi:hypothetical protein
MVTTLLQGVNNFIANLRYDAKILNNGNFRRKELRTSSFINLFVLKTKKTYYEAKH